MLNVVCINLYTYMVIRCILMVDNVPGNFFYRVQPLTGRARLMRSLSRESMESHSLTPNSSKSGNTSRKRLPKETTEKLARLGVKLSHLVKLFDNLKEKLQIFLK